LGEYLRGSREPEVTLSYGRIEELIGGPLPASSTKWRPQVWSNAQGNGYSRIWRDVGYRTNLAGLADDEVRFVRVQSLPAPITQHEWPSADKRRELTRHADVLLLGCVKTKKTRPGAAKDVYDSPLWERRRRFAEASGRPWVILSAEHGVLDPDETIVPYDRYLTEQPHQYRMRWAHQVVQQLRERFGDLSGMAFELHASRSYGDPIEPLLRAAGATLLRPLAGLPQGRQLRWYDHDVSDQHSRRLATASPPRSEPLQHGAAIRADVSRRLTAAFVRGELDLRARPDAPSPGWHSMPEVRAVGQLREAGAGHGDIRTFLTLVAALDRARDADRLWDAGANLFLSDPWVYTPSLVTSRPLTSLADALRESRVSQRHGIDTYAWRTICESLQQSSPVSDVVGTGDGDTATLLAAVRAETPSGTPLYPLLRGEKISTMWVRLLAHPGGASIRGLAGLPVAVDVQVRKVTEYLGVAATAGLQLDFARPLIQAAWRRQVAEYGAVGPQPIDGTSGALDPALWFFAKWGCTTCERHGRRRPISDVCDCCRFDELRQEDEAPPALRLPQRGTSQAASSNVQQGGLEDRADGGAADPHPE
jgi:hypothetical protein